MSEQITDTIMMVRPAAFQMNEETAVNNFYQKSAEDQSSEKIQQMALQEFDGFVEKLRAHGVEVLVFQDKSDNQTPDSIFPNNWNSFHADGTVYIFPMFAENRRREARQDILEELSHQFDLQEVRFLTHWESKNKFLEGTGSMILDRENMLAYTAISDRTDLDVLRNFEEKSEFEPVCFTAFQTVEGKRLPIYHTNVMMCLGDGFVVICLDSIDDLAERKMLSEKFEVTGKEVIEITEDQCNHFAGNMLQVKNKEGDRFVVMSESAYQSLLQYQKEKLESHGQLIHHSLYTIEKYGGGSARCMMAEIFLQPKYNL